MNVLVNVLVNVSNETPGRGGEFDLTSSAKVAPVRVAALGSSATVRTRLTVLTSCLVLH